LPPGCPQVNVLGHLLLAELLLVEQQRRRQQPGGAGAPAGQQQLHPAGGRAASRAPASSCLRAPPGSAALACSHAACTACVKPPPMLAAGKGAVYHSSSEARVALLASMTHFDGQLDMSDLQWEDRPYDPYRCLGSRAWRRTEDVDGQARRCGHRPRRGCAS
jgi:hypothetical protein